jgi:transcription antitermination protein NusB
LTTTPTDKTPGPRSLARDFAVQFLYQCEAQKIFHFSKPHFVEFVNYFKVPDRSQEFTEQLVSGVLEKSVELDNLIESVLENWNIQRITVTDKAVLRVALFEMENSDTPFKVILNEGVELAKKYGSEKSGKFVNGVLDKLAARKAQ